MPKSTDVTPVARYRWERMLKASDAPPMTRLVGMMLATYTNKDGTKAHPGIERLVRDCGVSNEKTIRRHLLALVDLGLIHRVFHGSAAGRRAWADEYVLTAPEGVETLPEGIADAIPEPRATDENTGLSTSSVDSGGPERADPGVHPPIPSTNPVSDHHADHLDLPRETRGDEASEPDPDRYDDPFEYLNDQLVFEAGRLTYDEQSTLDGMASEGRNYKLTENTVRAMIRARQSQASSPRVQARDLIPPWLLADDDREPSSLVFVENFDDPWATVPPRRGRSYDDEEPF